MTKKDFIAIARAVRIARLEGMPDAWSHVIVARLADACRADNPKFDENKFRRACWNDKDYWAEIERETKARAWL